ncbi:hypothetical protein [Croceicoccus gelatinilyticus]|uniref:hypothetical protein n=1 Tax=Croceicoccus gelatinilyticus TaxID=2835536 RepID=UPI001BCEB5CD|nr:hypothetical protein [Croceicoccus gelatinilyticus]MBS7671442.1 hypothetical protein [Croceicoccus gelatinilyticus]
MAGLLGAMVGGVLGFFLISAIIGLFAFKKDPPESRALKTCMAALLVIAVLAGIGNADGQGFAYFAWVMYVPGAIIGYFYWRNRYNKHWTDDEIEDAET